MNSMPEYSPTGLTFLRAAPKPKRLLAHDPDVGQSGRQCPQGIFQQVTGYELVDDVVIEEDSRGYSRDDVPVICVM